MALDARPIPVRLAEHTTVDASGCHLWLGYRVADGYGHLKVNGIAQRVHRLAWQEAHGPIPEGLCVCHKCDTPNCINVDHLFLGTVADNMADKVRKGRHVGAGKGESHWAATLSAEQVRSIRLDGRTQQEIADDLNVSRSLIQLIKAGKRWAHVT
jgi:hypothetical protein